MPSNNDKLIRALQKMWRKEWEAAQAYRQVAKLEKDERRRGILTKLADIEEGHAAAWAQKIEALGGQAPTQKPPLPTSMRYAPPEVILEKMEQEEERIEAAYQKLSDEVAPVRWQLDWRRDLWHFRFQIETPLQMKTRLDR